MFESYFQASILRASSLQRHYALQDPLILEISHHINILQTKVAAYVGRQAVVDSFCSSVKMSRGGQVFVVHGVSGCGKTSFLAKVASSLYCDQSLLVVRFLGTSPQSSNMRAVLESVCQQIQHLYGSDLKIPSTYKVFFPSHLLFAHFRNLSVHFPLFLL